AGDVGRGEAVPLADERRAVELRHGRLAVRGERERAVEHDRVEVEGPALAAARAEGVEVVLLPIVDVLEVHDDDDVAVVPALLVEESDRMPDLVDDAAATAILGQVDVLLAALASDG